MGAPPAPAKLSALERSRQQSVEANTTGGDSAPLLALRAGADTRPPFGSTLALSVG